MGILGILQVIFIFCKVAEVTALATWAWGWIFLPLWIYLAILFFVLFVAGTAASWKGRGW